jgi:hypothetical protein
MTDTTATTAVAVSTPAHLSALQEFGAGLASLWAKLTADLGIVAKVQTEALPTEIAMAQIGAVAAGAGGLAPAIGEAGLAAEAANTAASGLAATPTAVTPANLSAVLVNAANLANAVSTTYTAATGKSAPAQLQATTAAIGAAAEVTAAIPPPST